jgi:nitrogenase molybdenum-iron protein alpha/beta subunit
MKEITTIMGSDGLLEQSIEETRKKFKPSIIAVISTALSEVRGEDIEATVREMRKTSDIPLYKIEAPDYKTAFAEGYGRAILGLLQTLAVGGEVEKGRVNVFCGAHLTAADADEIRSIFCLFGFSPVLLPDMGAGMDGSKDKFSNIPLDGTSLKDVELAGRAERSFVFGHCLVESAEFLQKSFSVPFHEFSSLTGLDAVDQLVLCLLQLRPEMADQLPQSFTRNRGRLKDALVDTHLLLKDKRVLLAMEAEHALSLSRLILETGASVHAILPHASKATESFDFPYSVGDLEDVEDLIVKARGEVKPFDLLISNSHAAEVARRVEVPLLRAGFPIFDRYGETLRLRTGYAGSYQFVFEMANAILESHAH